MAGFGVQPVGGKVWVPPSQGGGPAQLGGPGLTVPPPGGLGIAPPPPAYVPPVAAPPPPDSGGYGGGSGGSGGSGGGGGIGPVSDGGAPAPTPSSISPSMTALGSVGQPQQNEGWGAAQQTPLEQGLGTRTIPASGRALVTLAAQRGTVY